MCICFFSHSPKSPIWGTLPLIFFSFISLINNKLITLVPYLVIPHVIDIMTFDQLYTKSLHFPNSPSLSIFNLHQNPKTPAGCCSRKFRRHSPATVAGCCVRLLSPAVVATGRSHSPLSSPTLFQVSSH